jgi:N-acylglucosamine 2-epimerase
MQLSEYQHLYRDNLLNDVIPFWLQNSGDKDFGGYFTCLDRQGAVYDTDKFVWLQARQVWCFSMLYNRVEKKQEWLDFAIQGAAFLQKHGRDADGNWYFSLTREGQPLVQPYNIFSDCFATMAFGQLYQATGVKEYGTIAVDTFLNILARKDDPKGAYNKAFPGTRPLKNFALPMILCNLV